MVCATLEGLWMVSDWIVDLRFFLKFHRSGPARIFSFWIVKEHVSYASKKLLIKQKTSSTWCVLLCKDYGWFLIKLSIFDFLSNFTGPDLHKFSVFQLWQRMLVMHQKISLSHKRPNQHGECYFGRIMDGFWLNCRFSIFPQISQIRTCNNFQFLNSKRAC